MYKIKKENCINCDLCKDDCEFGAINTITEDDIEYCQIDPEKCTECGICFENCPCEAIEFIEI